MLEPAAKRLLDAIREPCMIVDHEGLVVAANRTACRTLKREEAAIAGRPLEAVLDAGSEPIDAYLRRCFGNGEATLGSLLLRGGDAAVDALRIEGCRLAADAGSCAQVLLRMSPRQASGSQFVALNQRLAELGGEVVRRQRAELALAAKVAELEQADRQKNRFIALLSHELRNPLAPIRMALHILTLDPRPERLQRSLAMMQRHVLHLIRLVDDLLDFSRIATGKIRIEISEASLDEILEVAAAGVRPRIDAKAQALEVVAAERISVRADPDRLRQVMGNLLDNASKFTPEGGRIVVGAAVESGQAVIRVKDSGPGIPPALHSKVFEYFAQGDNAVDRAHNGLGLGLALARSLCELQGGSVTLAPRAGNGAEFIVTVPLAAVPASARGADASPTAQAPAALGLDAESAS